jgi:Putative type VII ESX secretion system translocon, EccE
MTASGLPPEGPPAVRFGQRSTRGLLLGLSAARCLSAGCAICVVVLGLVAGGGIGLLASGLVWVPLLLATFVSWQGVPLCEWAPVVGHWSARKLARQSEYRARVSTPRPAGTMALPGDAAALRFYEDLESGACMVHDPHRQSFSVTAVVTHPAYVLLSASDQRSRVAAWGKLLASLSRSGNCAAIQVLEATLPDPGTGVAAWYERRGTHDGGWADTNYATLLRQSSHDSSAHRSTITISLDTRRAAKAIREAGRGTKGAAAVLTGQMEGLEHSLRAADLHLERWLDAAALAVMVRQAYDPGTVLRQDWPGADLDHAGPVALSEHWSYLRHDSGFSTVLWISEWPRQEVAPNFLHSVIFAQGVRRSFSLVAHPQGTQEALRQIRKEKTEAITDSVQRAKIGQTQDLSDRQQYEDVLTREQALISGHADVMFSGFVTVTASSRHELSAAVAQIEQAAAQASCETRVLYGRQAQGFVVGALPLARSVL